MDILKTPFVFTEGLVHQLREQFAWVAVEPRDWQGLVQAFLWCHWGFETFLLGRQYDNYQLTEIPPALVGDVDQETFIKSQNYGRDKAKFSFFSSVYHQGIQFLSLYYYAYPKAWSIAGSILHFIRPKSKSEIAQSIIFVFFSAFVSNVLDLPLSVYSTFVLEAKHGFNKTTVTTFITDIIKSWMVGLVIGAPFLAAFVSLVEWAGDSFVPYLMVFLVTFQMIMVIIYPTFIQPLFNKLTPLPEGELRGRIEKVASSLDYPLAKLYQIDGSKRSSHSNAYMYGLPWSKHIVIFDTLIEQSNPSEVEAVIAHELGHWYYNHPMKLLGVSQFHLFFILMAFTIFQHSPPVLKSFGFSNTVARKPPTLIAFYIFQLILTPTEAVLSFFMHAISRHFEYQADHFAADLPARLGSRYVVEKELPSIGDRLGKALVTLHVKNLSTFHVDRMFSAYHHSHPTLVERLSALAKYKTTAGLRDKKDL